MSRDSLPTSQNLYYVDAPDSGKIPHDKQPVPDEITMAVYLDTTNAQTTNDVLQAVELLRELSGYGPEHDVEVRHGSIFKRSRAAMRGLTTSREVRERLIKLERALELIVVDRKQAEFDSAEALAVQQLLESLRDVQRACIRVGSILVVKYVSGSEAVVLVRNLSQLEVRAMERYPEIQLKPEVAFSALATAIASMEKVHTHSDNPGGTQVIETRYRDSL